MNITATHINYYRMCQRKLWLFANNIQMEHGSDLVAEGKIIEEETYQQRSKRYLQISLSVEYAGVLLTGKFDFFDVRNRVVHETKRSNKVEDVHIWQVKFYLWLLELKNIEAKKGIIEYPKMREAKTVRLSDSDRDYLTKIIPEIHKLVTSEHCPPVIKAKLCKSCSYYDFCYINENEL